MLINTTGMKFFIVDVFGISKYTGNQLAVFFDFGKLSAEEMQKIAREINFSETTFVTSSKQIDNGYNVRIFTPRSEIDFAGHPTLGTAFIISLYLDTDKSSTINLNLNVGQIPAVVSDTLCWMQQNQPIFGNTYSRTKIASVLGIDKSLIDPNLPIQEISTGLAFIIVPLKNIYALQQCNVNVAENQKLMESAWAKGILVFTAEGYTKEFDISSRVFVHSLGIPEDPATGSATGCLAAYLLENKIMGNSIESTVAQGYEIGRPSLLYIKAQMEKGNYNICVGGNVIEISEGNWND